MSLINDMLKDLESRGTRTPGTGDVRATAANRRQTRARWPLVVLMILVVAMGAVLAYLVASRPAKPPAVDIAFANTERPAVRPDPMTATPKKTPDITMNPSSTPVEVIAEPAAGPVVDVQDEVPSVVSDPVVPAEARESLPDAQESAVVPRGADAKETAADSVIVRRHEPTPAETAERARREGFAALERGDWATAARLLQQLLVTEPANDDAREGLVVALSRQGRIAEADGVLLDGLAVAVEPARFAKLRARVQAARGELDAALDSLSVSVPAIATDPEYHALKGALAQQADRHAMAADIYRGLVAFEPANGTWQAGYGMALDRLGDHDGARTAYRRAFETRALEPALQAYVERRLRELSNADQAE